jgi:acetoin utilization protein AcuC
VSSEHPITRADSVAVYCGEELARYGFGYGHPFGMDRLDTFWTALRERGVADRVTIANPVIATRDEIESFHLPSYVDLVVERSESGQGFLDYGDTPAFEGIYEAAAFVVGSTVDAVGKVASGEARRAFVPIAGLHHARRDTAGGFCVFNDCGVAIELLRSRHGVRRIAYVDIDAHHGDGVLYGFEDDPELVIGDIHEDGRFLYPGTGWTHETGSGPAEGTKLNIPMPPGAGDDEFLAAWDRVQRHIDASEPEFIILQCGADGLAGDPLTHLQYSAAAHRTAATALCDIADRHCGGRLVALGGGGYSPRGIGEAWCAVVDVLVTSARTGSPSI